MLCTSGATWGALGGATKSSRSGIGTDVGVGAGTLSRWFCVSALVMLDMSLASKSRILASIADI